MPNDSAVSTSDWRWTTPPWATRVLSLAALIGLWQAGSDAGLISAFVLPPPSETWRSLLGLVKEGDIFVAFLRTLFEGFGAFIVGCTLGLALGWCLHRFSKIGRAYTNWVGALAASPLVLLYPVFLVVIGRNEGTIIAMGALVATPSIVIKTKEGLDEVRTVFRAVGKTLGLTPWQMFRLIEFPAALPTIFVGVRLGLIFALINTVAVEFLLDLDGLGRFISDLGDRFDLGGMYAVIVFVLLISALLLYLIERAQAWLLTTR